MAILAISKYFEIAKIYPSQSFSNSPYMLSIIETLFAPILVNVLAILWAQFKKVSKKIQNYIYLSTAFLKALSCFLEPLVVSLLI